MVQRKETVAEQILSGKIKATGLGRIPQMLKKNQITKKEAIYRINLLLSLQHRATMELPLPARSYAQRRGKVPFPLKPVRLKKK